jgi:hypothetical protein
MEEGKCRYILSQLEIHNYSMPYAEDPPILLLIRSSLSMDNFKTRIDRVIAIGFEN